MDKKAKLLDRLQNLAIAVLSLSFLFLLVQTPLFGDAGDTTIASTVRGWFTDRQTSAAEEPDSLAALAVPVRIVQSNDFIRSGLDALTTADDAFETVGSFLGEAIGSARGSRPFLRTPSSRRWTAPVFTSPSPATCRLRSSRRGWACSPPSRGSSTCAAAFWALTARTPPRCTCRTRSRASTAFRPR